jgi:flagellar basal-body rod protein FlgG
MKALQIAATGMLAQQTRVSVLSNNIANADTTAYHARRAEFADLIYQQEKRAGAVSSDAGTLLPAGVQVGLAFAPRPSPWTPPRARCVRRMAIWTSP